jgi:hypothetical protein
MIAAFVSENAHDQYCSIDHRRSMLKIDLRTCEGMNTKELFDRLHQAGFYDERSHKFF